MKLDSEKKLAVSLVAVLVLLAVNALISRQNIRALIDNDHWVAHTHEVMARLQGLLASLEDVEIGQRGYLLTENEEYLQTYHEALGRLNDEIRAVRELTADNPSQQKRLRIVEPKIESNVAIARESLALRREGKAEDARRIVLMNDGKQTMDEIRALIRDMENDERQLLRQRDDRSAASAFIAIATVLAATALAVGLVVIAFILGQRNIAERRRAVETGERFRITLSSIGDAVIVTDAAGTITLINAAAVTLTGWTREAVGRPLDEVFCLIDEMGRQPIESPVSRVLREGTVVGLANHTILICRNGNERAIADSAAPIRARDGTLKGVVLVFHDVTERRAAERALLASEERIRRLNEDLEQRVVLRTKEVEERNQDLARSEAALRESELHLRSILDSSPECIKVIDLEGRLQEINRPGRAMFEIADFDHLRGTDWTKLWPEEERGQLREAAAKARSGDVGRFEGWRRTVNGALRYWDVQIGPITGADGLPRSLVSVSRDVTEQKLAHRRAEVQYAVARVLANASRTDNVLYQLLAAVCGRLEWQRAEYWGCDGDSKELRCLEDWQAIPEAYPQFRAFTKSMTCARGIGAPGRVWESGQPMWIEDVAADPLFVRAESAKLEGLHGAVAFPIAGADNSKVMVIFSGDVQPLDDELLRAFEAIGAQVGQYLLRQRAETELRLEEQRYRSLVEAATAIVWNTPASGEFESEQLGWSRFTGQSFDELRGWGWLDAVHAGDRAHTASVWSAAVASRSLYEVEHRLRRRDGAYRYMQVRAVPILDDHGKIREWIGIHTDVHEAKQVELLLREAKAAAEAANRTKSDFLANMSHEIRTPMNGIIGMTDLALDTELTVEQRDFISTVRASATALLSLINDILDFSKIEAGKLELDPHPFSLRDGLGDLLKPLAFRAHKKGLELACHVRPEVPDSLTGDLDRLQQIVINLVGNALKFTEKGEVVLRVECAPALDGNVELHFRVSDTGIGIPESKLSSIFEPFSQGDTSTSRKYGGTGLGLAICVQLVEMMGGRIWAESTPGRGSTFHFSVRLQVGAAVERQARTADLIGLRVLVADDNDTNRLILEELLTVWRMRPQAVASLPDAQLEIQRAEGDGDPFALLLVSASSPGTDGSNFQVPWSPANGCTPVILLSSGERVDPARWQGIKLAATLMRPPKQSDLLEAIVKAVGAQPAVSIIEAPAPAPLFASPRPLNVLLADDNRVNQRVGVALLQKQGHATTIAQNGQEVLDLLERQTFDLILMDVQMPIMDGLEATAAIRRKEVGSGRHIPIIALTANAMKGDREQCLASGMDSYISKPLEAAELWKVIGELVPADSAPGPIFDRAEALSHLGGNMDLLYEIAAMFRETSAAAIAEIAAALERNDSTTIQRSAHSLRGSAALFGAARVAQAAVELEMKGEAGELAGCADILPILRHEIEQLWNALDTLKE